MMALLGISGCGAHGNSQEPSAAESPNTASEHPDGGFANVPPCGGEETTTSNALSTRDYEIALPTSGVLAENTVTTAQLCPSVGSYLVFSSGATLEVQVSDEKDPAGTWAALAKDNPTVYSVGTNQEVPALLIQPGGGQYKDAEGGVTFIKDGLYVAVGGNTEIPLDELTKAAQIVEVHPTQANE
jgi:hypothetical protein